MPITCLRAGGGKYSKHNILCGTVHEYHDTENNFCNGHLYEIQKSHDLGGNNAYKTSLSQVEEGNIPKTISFMELFMNTMKMKNIFCKGHQYEMQKS